MKIEYGSSSRMFMRCTFGYVAATKYPLIPSSYPLTPSSSIIPRSRLRHSPEKCNNLQGNTLDKILFILSSIYTNK